jgi:hypothetical protein
MPSEKSMACSYFEDPKDLFKNFQRKAWSFPTSLNGRWFDFWWCSCTRHKPGLIVLAYTWGYHFFQFIDFLYMLNTICSNCPQYSVCMCFFFTQERILKSSKLLLFIKKRILKSSYSNELPLWVTPSSLLVLPPIVLDQY